MKYFFFSSVLILLITTCKRANEVESSTINKEADFTVYTKTPDGQVVSVFYPTNSPQKIYFMNHQQRKEGFAYHYHKNGILIKKTRWENGKKEGEELTYDSTGNLVGKLQFKEGLEEGDMFLYKNGKLKTHQIKESGKLLYEGLYEGTEKQLNKLYPYHVEEFFFEDKYYAKIKFLIDYPGKMDLRVKDISADHIEQLKDNTFQLVINDALDLTAYELVLRYYPAPSDTLIYSTYLYEHIIYTD